MSYAMQIGRVSAQTGLSVDAIRFYEKQRLLQRRPRTDGGFRQFKEEDIQRILFIRRAQQMGFSLQEIRELLLLQGENGRTCSHVCELLRAKVDAVREKIRELGFLERHLTKSMRKCERNLNLSGSCRQSDCPVLRAISHRGSNEN